MKTAIIILLALVVVPMKVSSESLTSFSLVVPARNENLTGGRCLAAHPFARQSLIDALPLAADKTTVILWQTQSQSWGLPLRFDRAKQVWIDNQGREVNGHLEPGTAFWICNPSTERPLQICIHGRPPQEPTVIHLAANHPQAVAFAPPKDTSRFTVHPQLLECGAPRYTTSSMGYPSDLGDRILVWDETDQAWIEHSRMAGTDSNPILWSGEGEGLTPTIPAGRGFIVIPVTTKQWVQSEASIRCDEFKPTPSRRAPFSIRQYVDELQNFWKASQHYFATKSRGSTP